MPVNARSFDGTGLAEGTTPALETVAEPATPGIPVPHGETAAGGPPEGAEKALLFIGRVH
jgi:hypothetical protein